MNSIFVYIEDDLKRGPVCIFLATDTDTDVIETLNRSNNSDVKQYSRESGCSNRSKAENEGVLWMNNVTCTTL